MNAKVWIAVSAVCVALWLAQAACAQRIDLNGFVALEAEWHHEPGVPTRVWWEINRVKLNFSSELTERLSALAEFTPVPEEISHQLEELVLTDGRTLPDTSLEPDAGREEGEGVIPFERIEVRWRNLFARELNLSIGQLRNPFGHWEDFTAHRNSTMTKNNPLVLGIALRNYDLGAEVDGNPVSWLSLKAGFRKGNNVNTAETFREDNNSRYDLVARIGLEKNAFGIGVDGYAVDASDKKYAVGVDWQADVSGVNLMGEGVLEENRPEGVRSRSTYAQANYNLHDILDGLRCFALLEYWRLDADSRLQAEAYNTVAGLKYKALPEGITLTAEWGKTFFHGLPDPYHVTIQAEVSF